MILFEFPISDYAMLGDYQQKIYHYDDIITNDVVGSVHSITFKVDLYKLPLFEVQVEADNEINLKLKVL